MRKGSQDKRLNGYGVELGPPDYLAKIALADYLAHYMGATVINKPEKEIDSRVLGHLAINMDGFEEMKKMAIAKTKEIENLWQCLSF